MRPSYTERAPLAIRKCHATPLHSQPYTISECFVACLTGLPSSGTLSQTNIPPELHPLHALTDLQQLGWQHHLIRLFFALSCVQKMVSEGGKRGRPAGGGGSSSKSNNTSASKAAKTPSSAMSGAGAGSRGGGGGAKSSAALRHISPIPLRESSEVRGGG